MDYAALKVAVEDTVENTFSSVDFATMTRLAEQKINNTVQLPSIRKNATSALVAGNAYLPAPTDFLSVFSMAVITVAGAYEYLLNKDVNFIRESYPNPNTQGTPKYYAIFGPDSGDPKELTFIFGPTPSASLNVELHYFGYPESITVAASGRTWLGDNFESVLVNAVLVEAARFMKAEQDIVQLYVSQFNDSILLLKNLGDGKNRMDAYRSGQVRNPVK